MEREENDNAVFLPSHRAWKSIRPISTFPPRHGCWLIFPMPNDWKRLRHFLLQLQVEFPERERGEIRKEK